MADGIKILFVQDNGINESLALTELAAWLKRAGHDCRLLLEREERRLETRAAQYGPDLVILPCNVFAAGWVRTMATRLRRLLPTVPILVGGTHPTFAPDLIRHPAVSHQLVGEAELAVAELADRIAHQASTDNIPGIWVKRNGEVVDNGVAPRLDDLARLPLPDRHLYYRYRFMRAFPWKKFTTGRGCENRCTFCYNEHVRKLYCDAGFVRRKPVGQVIDEVLDVRGRSRLSWVHFADDLFVTDIEWLETFAREYPVRVGLPFSCNSSADRMSERVATLLARAGCRVVAVGVETADEERRVRMLRKPAPNRVIERAAALINGAGMEMVAFLMMALPGEQLPEALATLRYSRTIAAGAHRILMAVPLPGTEMTRQAAQSGLLAAEADDFDGHIEMRDNPYGPYYDVETPGAFENLANLAPVLRYLPDGLALGLARSLPRRLSRPFRLWMSFQERRLYGFSLLAGARFYLHVGNPMSRTTNYVTLI